MKTIKLFYFCLLLMFFGVVSCSTDMTKSFSEEGMEQLVIQRSSNDSGCNLLVNGDFEILTGNNPQNGLEGFSNGWVEGWNCKYATADVVNEEYHWNPNNGSWDGYVFDSNWAFTTTEYTKNQPIELVYESFYQDVDLSNDPDINYELSFTYSATSYNLPSGNGGLYIKVDLETEEESFACFDWFNPPVSNNVSKSWEIPVNDDLVNPETASFNSGKFKLPTGDDPNVLSFAAITNTQEEHKTEGVFYDDICLSCSSEYLTGVDIEVDGCSISFSAQLSGDLNITDYLWEFGDDNKSTSNEANPTFTYDGIGAYNVKLSIVDDRGCCTEVERVVSCGFEPAPSTCDFAICWSSDYDDCHMQHFEWVDGFTVIHPNGTEEYIPFEDPYYTLGYYDEIYDEWMTLLAAKFDLDNTYFATTHGEVNCDSHGVNIGFVVNGVDFEMKSFNGYSDIDRSVVMEQFFISPNCDFAWETCQ